MMGLSFSMSYEEFISTAAKLHGVSEDTVRAWLDKQLNSAQTQETKHQTIERVFMNPN